MLKCWEEGMRGGKVGAWVEEAGWALGTRGQELHAWKSKIEQVVVSDDDVGEGMEIMVVVVAAMARGGWSEA